MTSILVFSSLPESLKAFWKDHAQLHTFLGVMLVHVHEGRQRNQGVMWQICLLVLSGKVPKQCAYRDLRLGHEMLAAKLKFYRDLSDLIHSLS